MALEPTLEIAWKLKDQQIGLRDYYAAYKAALQARDLTEKEISDLAANSAIIATRMQEWSATLSAETDAFAVELRTLLDGTATEAAALETFAKGDERQDKAKLTTRIDAADQAIATTVRTRA